MWRPAVLTLACLAVLALFAAPASAEDAAKTYDRTSINDLIDQWRAERLGRVDRTNVRSADFSFEDTAFAAARTSDRSGRDRTLDRSNPIDATRRGVATGETATGGGAGDQDAFWWWWWRCLWWMWWCDSDHDDDDDDSSSDDWWDDDDHHGDDDDDESPHEPC